MYNTMIISGEESVVEFAEFVERVQGLDDLTDNVADWTPRILAICYRMLSSQSARLDGKMQIYDLNNLWEDFRPITEQEVGETWLVGNRDKDLPDREKVVHAYEEVWVEVRLGED